MHVADRHHPVLGLLVVDRVPAHHEGTRFLRLIDSTPQRVAEQAQDFRLSRPRDDVESEERSCAHRVDVTQRVGDGNRAKGVRVVDDRRKKVHRHHERAVVR